MTYEPSIELRKASGNKYTTSFFSTIPRRQNVVLEVKTPAIAASLFVPSATVGGRPVSNMAGNEIKPPPPTTLSMKAEINPAAINANKSKISVENNSIRYPTNCET